MTSDATPPPDAERLILAAFGDAAARGRDSTEMRAGVLKNRLLSLTDREFDERAWGVDNFLSFLELFPSRVEVDRTAQPPLVRLKTGDDQAIAEAYREIRAAPPVFEHREIPEPAGSWRIRRDLWSSVLDVSSSETWIWNGRQAVSVDPERLEPEDERWRLPTLSETELHQWRADFTAQQSQPDPAIFEAMVTWRDRHETSWSLPQPIRDLWFAWLKKQVRGRLVEWFQDRGLPLPDDFYESVGRLRATGSDEQRLREIVHQCVDRMTFEELTSLQIPASVVRRFIDR